MGVFPIDQVFVLFKVVVVLVHKVQGLRCALPKVRKLGQVVLFVPDIVVLLQLLEFFKKLISFVVSELGVEILVRHLVLFDDFVGLVKQRVPIGVFEKEGLELDANRLVKVLLVK